MAENDLALGMHVLIQGKMEGHIRHLGPTQFKEGIWCGVELTEPRGKNNGTIDGVTYFTCAQDFGLFIRPEYVSQYNEEDAAAHNLQRQVRKHLAKKKVKEKHAAKTWNMLDNLGEENALKRGKLLKKSTQMLKKQNVSQKHQRYEPMEEEDDEDEMVPTTVEEVQAMALRAVKKMTAKEIDAIRILPGYKGPHLKFPLQESDVLIMLEDFKLDHVLHYKYMMRLLMEAKAIFSSESTVQRIVLSEGVDLTVVGDLHGQLQDLFTIFSINGIPSEKKWYLFNGDFVDRGPKGCEIVATLCAFKVLYPKYVFLNRGNHEARAQNAWMGFDEELLGKYNERAEMAMCSTNASTSCAPSNFTPCS